MPPQDGLFSEAELHARLVEALGQMPLATVAQLRAAWQQGRAAFRACFFQLSMVDAILAGPSAVVFCKDDWADSFARVQTAEGRIQLAIPELFADLDALRKEAAPAPSAEYPFVLSAGERRSFTANTIIRNPDRRSKDRNGALRMHPDDAARVGLTHGGSARLSTKRGSVQVQVELSDRMQPGHISLPNGQGVDYPAADGEPHLTGVMLNELTDGAGRDAFAGTPWHKHTAARVEVWAPAQPA